MAHEVKVTLGEMKLTREEGGPVFTVKKDGKRFGEMRASKGGLRWKAKNEKGTADWHFVTWSQLDEWMKDKPRK